MATVVYQSYFESQHFEPKALRLRLSSPNIPHLSTPLKSSSITPQDNTNAASLSSSSPNSDSNASWSFLESLSNLTSDDDKEKKTLQAYIQPPSSRRTLSDESLALCTESLGSETGSDVINDQDFFSSSVSSESQTMEARTTPRTSLRERSRNMVASLPPPLTTMRGFDCIQVKPHRENGRLVMTASKPPPRNTCLQDRSNGCVRLAILISPDDEHIETETMGEETTEMESDCEEEIQEHEEEDEVMGTKTFQRSKRCHESDQENREFRNWESLCVATS